MPPPRIINHPMDIMVPVTEDAVFVCIGQGYGLVGVMWFRGNSDSERSPPGRSTMTTMVTPDNITTITSTLTIPDVNDNTPNRYRCRYSTSEGKTDSNIARLTIRCKF